MEYMEICAELSKVNVVDSEDSPSGFLEGYASVFGNVDLGGDVVFKGAFAKTLRERLKKGFIKIVDSHRTYVGTDSVIGIVREAKEDDHGLWFKGPFSSVTRAQEIRTKIKERLLDALSFGYDIVKAEKNPDSGVLELKELKLYEVSVVIWGMNPKAKPTVIKAVVPFQDFGITDDVTKPWDAAAAKKRIRSWVSSDDPSDWGATQWTKFRRCYLWYDSSNPTVLGSYKFPVVDITDGNPKYVFRAAVAALVRVRGTSGNWSDDRDKLEGHLKRIYKKFDQEFPEKSQVVDGFQQVLDSLSQTAEHVRGKQVEGLRTRIIEYARGVQGS